MELNNVDRATKLESSVLGCAFSSHWWGITRKAGMEALGMVAETLGTNQKYLKVEKRLIDNRNVYYKNLVSLKSEIISYWKDLTLPYVEIGVRLIRKDLISKFESKMEVYKIELTSRVKDLTDNYDQLKNESRQALNHLFREEDYPQDLSNCFSFHWDYPNLNPPEYLMSFDPQLYKKQQDAVRAKFEEAVQKAEKVFCSELQNLVTNLSEAMQPNADGSRKRWIDNTVSKNFKDFFTKFKNISVSNSAELESLVQSAENIIDNVSPEQLKNDGMARQDLGDKMKNLSKLLEEKIGVQPRRTLIKNLLLPANIPINLPVGEVVTV